MTTSLFSLEGRLALVTGSGQGIGLALAAGLAGQGAAVVVNGRSTERTEAAAAELRQRGYTAHAAAFDVTDFRAVDAAVERIERETGAIDILVSNAGIQHRAPLDEFPKRNGSASSTPTSRASSTSARRSPGT